MDLPQGFRWVRAPDDACYAALHRDLPDAAVRSLWAAGSPLGADTVGTGGGRGSVVALEECGLRLVARDLRRGGLLRRLLPDRFLDSRRSLRELLVLERLRAAGVGALEPVAVLVHWRGPFARQRLVTRRFEGARPLLDLLAAVPGLRREAIRGAGRVVGAAFAAGLRHPDLHPENVLATVRDGDVEVRLCDLDRASVDGRPVPTSARTSMLTRMVRFTVKHRARLPVRPSRSDQLRFLRAFLEPAAARATYRAVADRLARQLRRRRYS